MSVEFGTKLGAFEITGLLGKGGMGEVYRARDTKLGREVAIKVLPEALAGDAERLARFEREAAILASLDHPNIGAIYDLQHDAGIHFLVMQLIEGETLADMIDGGPVSVDEAVPIFLQIAEGLEEAHSRGIIHRDLKPANIKVDDTGRVRILDFGIAKPLFEDEALSVSHTAETLPSTPTPFKSITGTAVLIGTPSYMSPEQARGRRVDRRTDIWAFGCCLYEALTGERPFHGDTIADTVTEVLRSNPDFTKLPSGTPTAVRLLLRRCLEKDPKRRLRDIGEAWLLLEAGDEISPFGVAVSPKRSRAMLLAVVAVMLGAGIGALAIVALWPRPSGTVETVIVPPGTDVRDSMVHRFILQLPPDEELSLSVAQSVDIAPDGSAIVYSTQRGGELMMNVQPLDAFSRVTLRNISDVSQPHISPDGTAIVVRRPRGDGAEMLQVPLYGGTPTLTARVPSIQHGGAVWARDGYIYYAPSLGEPIWRIAAAGGEPEPVTTLEPGEIFQSFPQLLPGGRYLLFGAVRGGQGEAVRNVYAQDLETGERKHIVEAGFARYLPTGHLLYVPTTSFGDTLSLLAAPFDPETLELAGGGAAVLRDVFIHPISNHSHIAVADNGTVAYVPRASTERLPVWVDMAGNETPLKLSKGIYSTPRISPDGKMLLLTIGEGNSAVWTHDLDRGMLDRVTFESGAMNPLWLPGGDAIAYNAISDRGVGMFMKRLRSSAEAIDASSEGELQWPSTTTGNLLGTAYINPERSDTYDIRLYRILDDLRLEPMEIGFNSEQIEGPPDLSPDGRWIAFSSVRAGFWRVYVARVAADNEVYPVSASYGVHPVWSPSGDALYYPSGGSMVRVSVNVDGDTIRFGDEEHLFETAPYEIGDVHQPPNFDIAGDGERFLMLKRMDTSTREMGQINVVLNWFEELNRLVPIAGNQESMGIGAGGVR